MNFNLNQKIGMLACILSMGIGSIAATPASAEVIRVLLQGESFATKGVNVTVGQQVQAQAVVLTSLSDYKDVSLGTGTIQVKKQIVVFVGQDPCTKYAKSNKYRLGAPTSTLTMATSDDAYGKHGAMYSGKTEIPILTRTTGKRVGPLTDLGTVCIIHYSYSVDKDNKMVEGIGGSFGFAIRQNLAGTNGVFNTFRESLPVTLSGYVRSFEIVKSN